MNEALSCEDYVKNLVDSVVDDCRNVEEMAMLEINARHIPLINSTLCLTKGDCTMILHRCQHNCHNVWETSVLLIALTDFISCVSANYETFPLGNKKETRQITVLLQTLKKNWKQLFAKLSPADINISQMAGIANIVKRCSERIPSESTYKIYMEIIMKMTEEAQHKLLATQEINDRDDKKTNKNNNKRKTKKASREITSSKSHAYSKSSETVFQVPENRHLEQRKENKGKVKQSYDTTKFILKPCENMMKDETNEKTKNHLKCKRKFHDIESEHAVLDSDQIEKDHVEHLEADEASPTKRHCVHDDFINGKMNAFKMLMKQHKANSRAKQSSKSSVRH